MTWALRHLLFLVESLIYGPGYGAIHNLIRNPTPLEPERLWQLINPDKPSAANWLSENYPPAFMRRLLLAAKMRQDHLLGIAEHYDVSNEFYKLFLDQKYMFYSCADFASETETLEQAQSNKANFLLKLIDPKPGEKILDLGCGWGPMLKRICEETGDRQNLFGYTLSQEQVEFNKQQNGFNVEFKNFITCDYPEAEFDKIYSIGAWEHVRRRDLPRVLAKLYRALKPGGRMIKHFFCPLSEKLTNDAVIAQIFFPGSLQPAYPRQVKEFELAGFRITHQSIHDYRPTLRAWFDNLVRNQDRAIELVGVRTYNKYLVFLSASYSYFDRGNAILVRFVLQK